MFESIALVASGDEETVDGAEEEPTAEDEASADGQLDRARLAKLEEVAHASVPLSVQVGLKVKRVIIDAGHGGHDTGAIGPKGTREKDVVLAIALKLRDKLQAEGFEALMTRETDKFVALEDRARFANRKKGDLFVSIHCNANKSRKLRGTETYTLNVSSDRYAIRLAARENASSERSLSDLQFILADLATKANTE
ncbi:MAG TPA: N-acetylmuramoyl-L-alanine amidase, partial [Myxococcales bacterium]|nr:N-acetylmuramoyl-L-alanine amidase [Myxococcales bacterium]